MNACLRVSVLVFPKHPFSQGRACEAQSQNRREEDEDNGRRSNLNQKLLGRLSSQERTRAPMVISTTQNGAVVIHAVAARCSRRGRYGREHVLKATLP